ncbi:hypothetical protein EVA_16014, partial [gut metagenome]
DSFTLKDLDEKASAKTKSWQISLAYIF